MGIRTEVGGPAFAKATAGKRRSEVRGRRAGSAAVEFVVGMIAVVALVAGAYQLTFLLNAQSRVVNEARRDAGLAAMGPLMPLTAPAYIEDVLEGPDGKPYTADDTFRGADAGAFRSTIVAYTSPDQAGWEAVDGVPGDFLTPLRESLNPSALFGLVQGRAEEEVPLLPAVQELLYRDDSITLESEVWMTELGGIY